MKWLWTKRVCVCVIVLFISLHIAGCGASKTFQINTELLNLPVKTLPLDVALFVPDDCFEFTSTSNEAKSSIRYYSGNIGEALCPEFESLLRQTFRSVTVINSVDESTVKPFQAVFMATIVGAHRYMSSGVNWGKKNATYLTVDMIMTDNKKRLIWDRRFVSSAETGRGTMFTVKKNQLEGLKKAAYKFLQQASDAIRNSSEISEFMTTEMATGPEWETYKQVYYGRPLSANEEVCAELVRKNPQWESEDWSRLGIPLKYFQYSEPTAYFYIGVNPGPSDEITFTYRRKKMKVSFSRVHGFTPIPALIRNWRFEGPFGK